MQEFSSSTLYSHTSLYTENSTFLQQSYVEDQQSEMTSSNLQFNESISN